MAKVIILRDENNSDENHKRIKRILSEVQYKKACTAKHTYDLCPTYTHYPTDQHCLKFICEKTNKTFYIDDRHPELLLDENRNVVFQTYDEYNVEDILS